MRIAWSCVLDEKPAIWASAIPWLRTATECAGIEPSMLFVHHVCPLRPDVEKVCRELGVNTRQLEAFDPLFPHTNKVQQCLSDFGDADCVALMDVDTVFAQHPPLGEICQPVNGKAVDLPNPAIETMRNVFDAAELPVPSEWSAHYWNERGERVSFQTLGANYNGGMYVIQAQHLPELGRAWGRWSRWLIDRAELVKRWRHHLDQISFCMGVAELRLPYARLDDAWNFPLHLKADQDGREPFILHHHADFSAGFKLPQNDVPRAGKAIARVQRVMAKPSAPIR